MKFLSELIIYWVVKAFGVFVQILPVGISLRFGKFLGQCAYYLDDKHRDIVYSNLRIAFAKTKTSQEIRAIAKQTFVNYGQNLIELFRFPLLDTAKFREFVQVEGREHIDQAIKGGKGVIVFALHSGSWEMANIIGATAGYPYKVLVKAQTKNLRLAKLLDTFRRSGGSSVIERGMGTRTVLKSLKNNEIVSLVVDQGGKDGVLVPFFGKQASMSSGAIRISQKFGVPICFVSITRRQGPYHRLVVQKPLTLVATGNEQLDLKTNLTTVVAMMEKCICEAPAEYMWFYKIWKYSKQAEVGIITDGKAGHLRQSEAVAGHLKTVLGERGIVAELPILQVNFKNKFFAGFFAFVAWFSNIFKHYGRVWLLRLCLIPDSFAQLMSIKPDFIVSCGSSVAPVNFLLAREYKAKNIAILKPGMVNFRNFNLVILPRHDTTRRKCWPINVVATEGAPNLVTPNYLAHQTQELLKRFSHLKSGDNLKIGVLLGGDTAEFILSEQKILVLIHQLMEIAEEMKADILLTTSRRTSTRVENLVLRQLSKYNRCKFLVLANRENVPQAVGGILGLADVIVVSGESISMVSEALSAGKKVAAFFVEHRSGLAFEKTKHGRFLEGLGNQGYLLLSDVKYMKDSIYKLIKNKVQTKQLDDNLVILETLRKII